MESTMAIAACRTINSDFGAAETSDFNFSFAADFLLIVDIQIYTPPILSGFGFQAIVTRSLATYYVGGYKTVDTDQPRLEF